MKNIFALFFLLCCLLTGAHPARGLEDAIIALVNNHVITMKDLRTFMNSIYLRLKAEGLPEREIQQQIAYYQNDGLKRLIEEKLILDEADRLELVIPDRNVEQKIEKIKEQYPSEQHFLENVVEKDLTVTDLENKIKDDIKIKYMLDNFVRKMIFIKPQEITAYYQEHQDEFAIAPKAKVDSIYLQFKDDDRTKILELANNIKAQIDQGTDFLELIEEYSDSPSIKTVQKGTLLPEVEKIIFNLKPQQVSEPIETETGVFIFKIIKKVPAQQATLEEVQDEIQSRIYEEKYLKRLTQWLEELKKEAYIEIKE